MPSQPRKRSAPSSVDDTHVEKKPRTDANGDTTKEEVEETPKLSKGGKPLVGTLFEPFEHGIELPPPNDAWGTVPYPCEKTGPQPHSDQPPARSSNAETIPLIWVCIQLETNVRVLLTV